MIWTLIKKDFVFNWKTCIGMPLFFTVCMLAEFLDGGINQYDAMQFSFILALICLTPVIHSLDKENTPSTKNFLSALPIETKDLILSKIILNLLYEVFIFSVLLSLNCLFPVGFSTEHFLAAGTLTALGGAGYVFYSYMKNRELAQVFIWCTFIPLLLFAGWGREWAIVLWNKLNPVTLCIALIASVVLEILAAAALMKKKRRLLR